MFSLSEILHLLASRKEKSKVCCDECSPHTLSGCGEFPEGKMYLVFLEMKPNKAKQLRSQEGHEDQGCEDDGCHRKRVVLSPSLFAPRQTHSLPQLYRASRGNSAVQ